MKSTRGLGLLALDNQFKALKRVQVSRGSTTSLSFIALQPGPADRQTGFEVEGGPLNPKP